MADEKDKKRKNSKGKTYDKFLKDGYGDGKTFQSQVGRNFARASNEFTNFRQDGQAAIGSFLGRNRTAEDVRSGFFKPGGSAGDSYRLPAPPRSNESEIASWVNPSTNADQPIGRLGGRTFGKAPAGKPLTKDIAETIANVHRVSRRDGSHGAIYARNAPPPEEIAPPVEDPFAAIDEKSFADYLAEANAMSSSSSSGGPDYSAMEANLRNNATQGSAKLAAMFSALRASIDADATGIAQNYDTGSAALQQSAGQSSTQTKQAYDSTQAAQTQQMQALGIGETAGVLAASGGNAARDQALAQGNIAQNLAANSGAMTRNKTAALNYNTGVGNAAGLEGATQQATLQQRLAQKLAEIQVARSSDASQSRSDNTDLAKTLADFDNSRAQRRQEQMAGPSPEDTNWDLRNTKLAQEIQITQDQADTFASQTGVSMDAALKAGQASGFDMTDADIRNGYLDQYYKYNKPPRR